MLEAIGKLPVSEEQRAGIYGRNPATLLGEDREGRAVQ
jgi:hypothetical protein